jgi:hypothetical protein
VEKEMEDEGKWINKEIKMNVVEIKIIKDEKHRSFSPARTGGRWRMRGSGSIKR